MHRRHGLVVWRALPTRLPRLKLSLVSATMTTRDRGAHCRVRHRSISRAAAMWRWEAARFFIRTYRQTMTTPTRGQMCHSLVARVAFRIRRLVDTTGHSTRTRRTCAAFKTTMDAKSRREAMRASSPSSEPECRRRPVRPFSSAVWGCACVPLKRRAGWCGGSCTKRHRGSFCLSPASACDLRGLSPCMLTMMRRGRLLVRTFCSP